MVFLSNNPKAGSNSARHFRWFMENLRCRKSDPFIVFSFLKIMTFLLDSNPSDEPVCIIAEADPFLARLLLQFAMKSGLRIERVQTGESLLELLNHGRPALVILDPELPGKIRGWEAFQQVKMDIGTRNIPVIICTWLKEDDAQALLGEPCIFLHKPELHYQDFTASLAKAGVQMPPDETDIFQ